jgi:putative endonuclease
MREHNYFVYMMSNKSRRLYTGVTNNLRRRTYQHKHKLIPGFTSEYSFDMLVHYEHYSDIRVAISREKQIKGWLRSKKLALVLAENPHWADLSEGWYPQDGPPDDTVRAPLTRRS